MTILADVAQARVGYTFRGSLKHADHGDIAVIQMKDITPQALNQSEGLARVSLRNLSPHYLLQNGDLIFRSRGLNNQAWVYNLDQVPTICIAPLIFIRILDQSQLLPSYLEWFINLEQTQMQIASMARGETIAMISVATLHSLEIVLPPLARQQKITEIHQLFRQSQVLEEKLAQKRLQYTQTALLQFAYGQ